METRTLMSTEPASTDSPTAVARIADTLLSEIPTVQEHAVAEHATQQKLDALRDSAGVMFDESIHQRDAQGQPVKTAGGQWAKRRGRKAGSGPTKSVAAPPLVGTSGPVATPVDQARAAGANAAKALVTLGMLIGGDEWKPLQVEGVDEFAQLQTAFGDYFVAKNLRDIPPGIALLICVGGYVGPRCFAPVTRSRLSVAKAWISEKAKRFYIWYVSRK